MIQDVALDPTRGMMYISCRHEMVFADNSTHDVGAVYSATMAGDMVKPMVVGLGNPKGITMHGDEVIWVDPKRKAIEGISTINGTKYTLKRFLKTTDLHDITVADGYIYWTELEARAIKRSPFTNLTQTEIYGQEKFYRVPGLDSFTKEPLNETVCSIQDRDACRFMCIPSPNGARCICPDSTRYNRGRCRRRFHINYKKTKFCFTPNVENGKLVGNEPDVYVPIGYRLQFSCNPGYRVEWRKTIQNNKNGYILCNIGGNWNRNPACLWALPYTIHGDNRYGYAILHESTQFLVPSMVHLVNVICIGGGGGGFDSNNKEFKNIEKAGDGQDSKFGDVLISMGGEGGSLSTGGKGGIGTVLFGGNGGDTNLCHHGGAAGQMTEPRTCYQPSTFCMFCGAGGRKSSCPLCSGKVTGGCSGPLSPSDGSTEGSHYGGGASGGSGGGGGGAGFSRMNVDVTPGEMLTVVVGKGGAPSFAPPGDGIVVICWGGTIEDFLEVNVYDSLVKNILC
ncbi:uncharacterized protein LOC126830048 [Patella vulgata]|uniref:uncharacterized protein LOC126830048 n=1 Tax=Patella vulgata TaxID=6465 RepID=UPI0024A992B4|nr:uncharacterized protein LOC126830048 [Patella vulgata]